MSKRNLSSSGRWLTVFMLLAMLLSGVSTGANAEGLQQSGGPDAGAAPERIIRTTGALPGIYHIDYLNKFYNLDAYTLPIDGSIGFFTWSSLNPYAGNNGYNWPYLDDWIKSRVDRSNFDTTPTGVGIMISTYDTTTANDIRSTPNWVIKIPDAVIPATTSTGIPHYIDYFRRTARKTLNGEFESGLSLWTVSDPAAITVDTAPPVDSTYVLGDTLPGRGSNGNALQLGGVNNANATAVHQEETVPAMPPSLAGQQNVYVSLRVNIETTDPSPNDHLYVELWEGNTKLGGTQLDINNLSHAGQPADYWKGYTFDVTPFATEKAVKVVLKVVTDGANPTIFHVDNVQLRVRHLIPKYWGDAHKNAYKTFINALGARYRDTPSGILDNDPKYRLQFVAMGTGAYGESQPTQDVVDWEYKSTFDHVVKNAGMDTTGEWRDYVNEISLAYATAFGTGDPAGPDRHVFLQYAPSFISGEERGYTTDYAAALGVGLSHNRLAPEFTGLYTNDRSGFYDPIRLHWNSVPIAFEAYADDLRCNTVLSYWALHSAVEKHADYIRTDPDLLRNSSTGLPTIHAPIFDWARQYLGKTVQNTPRVWTVMREHRNPAMLTCGTVYYNTTATSARYPQYGNFNYWLYQVDAITGGKTVAETNDKGADSRYAKNPSNGGAYTQAGLGLCGEKAYSNIYLTNPPVCNPEPYNPDLPPLVGQNPNDYRDFYDPWDWTGEGKEAYVVRRTDQATNNPYMFFRIDDGYIPGTQVYSAKITVGYFDIGTDQWSLKYHSTTGEKVAGTVTKTNTKTYKEITFTVNDGKFANGLTGSTDFYLDSRAPNGTADGNEWVHKVEVEKLGAVVEPTHTPTVTVTPTQTHTPTATATSTPTTGVVEGRAYQDTNKNGAYNAGEPLLQGAVMALLNMGNVEVYTATSGADGVFRFAAVAPGQYKLVEKTPPPGYMTSSYSLTFVVNANQTLSGFDVGYQQAATATPTATATVTATATPTVTATPTTTMTTEVRRVYLPLVLR